jgi:hypothetical protein
VRQAGSRGFRLSLFNGYSVRQAGSLRSRTRSRLSLFNGYSVRQAGSLRSRTRFRLSLFNGYSVRQAGSPRSRTRSRLSLFNDCSVRQAGSPRSQAALLKFGLRQRSPGAQASCLPHVQVVELRSLEFLVE